MPSQKLRPVQKSAPGLCVAVIYKFIQKKNILHCLPMSNKTDTKLIWVNLQVYLFGELLKCIAPVLIDIKTGLYSRISSFLMLHSTYCESGRCF